MLYIIKAVFISRLSLSTISSKKSNSSYDILRVFVEKRELIASTIKSKGMEGNYLTTYLKFIMKVRDSSWLIVYWYLVVRILKILGAKAILWRPNKTNNVNNWLMKTINSACLESVTFCRFSMNKFPSSAPEISSLLWCEIDTNKFKELNTISEFFIFTRVLDMYYFIPLNYMKFYIRFETLLISHISKKKFWNYMSPHWAFNTINKFSWY